MTESSGKPDPNLDAELVGEVSNLATQITGLAGRIELASAETRANTVATGKLARSRGRHRIAITIAIVGLTIDLVLTVLVIHLLREQSGINSQQSCVNSRSQQFFTAERDKVAGQVAGLLKLKNAGTDRSKALAGFNQFVTASQHYLDRIAELPKC